MIVYVGDHILTANTVTLSPWMRRADSGSTFSTHSGSR